MNQLKKYYSEDKIEIGIDESGRGTLFGRVYVAAVIMNPYSDINLEIKDSKLLNKKKRIELRNFIEKNAIAFSVEYAENDEIDKFNILNTTLKTMHKVIKNIFISPDLILVDGNKFNNYYENGEKIPHHCIIKGDNKYYSIAAASILAKTYHDEYIEKICKKYNKLKYYDLLNNMGYGTKKHIEAIDKYGVTKFHRKSYSPCKNKKTLI